MSPEAELIIWKMTSSRDGDLRMHYRHSFPLLVIAAAASFATPTRGADDGSRYAALWEKTPGPAFVARHGMTPQVYQQEFDKYAGEGYCLTLVSGYPVGIAARYAAIWEQKTCPAFVARHGLTSAAYQKEFDTLVGQQGHRLKLVSGYNVGGQDFYAAIWEKTPGPPFVARHGMTSQGYQQEFDKWNAQQYRLKLVNGHKIDGNQSYAAIWEKAPRPAFVARHGMTSDGYQQEFDKWVGQGFRLMLVNGY